MSQQTEDIRMGWNTLDKQISVMSSKVYNQCVLSVVTLGFETWHFTKERYGENKEAEACRGEWKKNVKCSVKRASWIREEIKSFKIF